MNAVKSWYDWMGKQVHSTYASAVLVAMFFIEATVFFIPVDPLLILYCLEHRSRSFYYATIATLASVIGGVFGYLIGFALWQTIGNLIVTYIISPSTFAKAVQWFTHYETAAVLIAGFTPVPYKAVTIGAGFCKLPLAPFIFYSLIARGARFFLLAGIISVWGNQIKEYIDRYFNLLVILFMCLVFGGVWLIKMSSGNP
ncbi:MAG: YqaA family protein [Candidatus Babeliales bacterium]